MSNQSKRLAGPDETAKYTGFTKATLARFRCEQRLFPFIKIGSKVLYDLDLIDQVLEEHRINPVDAA